MSHPEPGVLGPAPEARSGRRWGLIRLAVAASLCAVGAALGLLFLTGQGSGGTLFQGIPDDKIGVLLRLADSDASPAISSGQAIATAIKEGVNFHAGSPETVQETVLLIMKETRPGLPENRLVWGVHFQDPAAALGGRYQFMGPDANILHEARFAIVLVDAVTGEYVLTMEGWERLDTLPPGLTPPPHPVSE